MNEKGGKSLAISYYGFPIGDLFKSIRSVVLAGVQTCQLFEKKLFVAFPWVVTSTGPGGFMICVFII